MSEETSSVQDSEKKEIPEIPEEKKELSREEQRAATKKKVLATKTERVDRSDWKAAYEHDRVEKKQFKFRVVYNSKSCIGSSHCILSDPYNFELDEENRAVLKDGKEIPNAPGTFVKIFETDEPHLVINAAKTCTPSVISVIDMKTGKRIAP